MAKGQKLKPVVTIKNISTGLPNWYSRLVDQIYKKKDSTQLFNIYFYELI